MFGNTVYGFVKNIKQLSNFLQEEYFIYINKDYRGKTMGYGEIISGMGKMATQTAKALYTTPMLKIRPFETLKPEIQQALGDILEITKKSVSINELPSISKEEALQMCKRGLKAFNNRRPNVELDIAGTKYAAEFIGGGGSKSAYKVLIGGEEACVLLPAGADWKDALNEATNVAQLKDLGVLTNDYCKIIEVKADGLTIPALITKPYNRHSFKIFDKKNPNDCLDDCFDVSKISEETLPNICSELVKDVRLLAKNNIALGCDSINLAIKEGKLRLYLNDLPYENLVDETFTSEALASEYLGNALDAFQALFSTKAFNSNQTLKNLGDFDYLTKISSDLLKLSEEELNMLGVGFSLEETKFLLGIKQAFAVAKNGNTAEADRIIRNL